MRKKQVTAAAIILLAAFTVFKAAAAEPEVSVSAVSAVVYEPVTKTVLFEKDADRQMLIASTTKLMTALVALERCGLEDKVIIPPESVGVEGSSLYLKAGEEMTLEELLYGMMLESGNDAAVAVAIHAAGSVEAFVELMNDRAAALGLENTHFANPHGLNAQDHYSSARDLAVIMAEAMDNPLFARIASTKTVTFGDRTYKNHNKLMWSYQGMVAGKTGYTKKAGRTLVTYAKRGSTGLICVTLNAPDDWDDQCRLYDMAFDRWELIKAVHAGEELARVPVIAGTAPDVGLVASEDIDLLVPRGTRARTVASAPAFLYAPVTYGSMAGSAVVTAEGQERETPLLCGGDAAVDDGARLHGLSRLRALLSLWADR